MGVGAFNDTSLALTDRSHADTKLSQEEEQLLQQRLEEMGKADQTWVFELASVFPNIAQSRSTSRQRMRCGFATFLVLSILLAINLLGNSLSLLCGERKRSATEVFRVGTRCDFPAGRIARHPRVRGDADRQ